MDFVLNAVVVDFVGIGRGKFVLGSNLVPFAA